MRIEPVLAWRAWQLGTHACHDGTVAAFLRSCVHAHPWPPGRPLHAACRAHAAPDPRCTCGIYAVRTREHALAWVAEHAGVLVNPLLIGRVNLWGRVLQHEQGFRGAVAYPYELEVLTVPAETGLTADQAAAQLRRTYLVDVVVAADPAVAG